MFLPHRSKTGACGVHDIQECTLISPGWSGSGGISGVELLAAAVSQSEMHPRHYIGVNTKLTGHGQKKYFF